MQRIERRAAHLPFLLIICLVGQPAKAAPRQDDTPSRVMSAFTIESPRRPANGLRYTITRAELISPILNQQNDVTVMTTTTKLPTSDGLAQMVSDRAGGLLETLRRSGIVDTLMRFLAPQQRAPMLDERDQQRDTFLERWPRRDVMSDSPTFSTSIDSRPMAAIKPSQSGLLPASGAADWKHTLFGPSGMFTEIFNIINEKRKEDERQKASVAAATSAAKTHADVAAQPDFDFAKIVDAFLTKTQSGTFDEPPPEIPFLGICDRLSCGDIYKAFDEFRKSELFSNFQTAISLLHDQKGWDIIGELLANPDLIDTFTDGAAKSLAGSKISPALAKGATGFASGSDMATLESTDDADIGVDFSEMIDEQPAAGLKSIKKEPPDRSSFGGDDDMPEISESVDYYNSVDKAEIEESVPQPSSSRPTRIASGPTKSLNFNRTAPVMILQPMVKFASGTASAMPEIAASVDEYPDGMTDHVDVEETVPSMSMTSKALVSTEKSNDSSAGGAAKIFGGNGSRVVGATIGSVVYVPSALARTMAEKTTTSSPSPRTTRRNFRRFNDYYSMYYDNSN